MLGKEQYIEKSNNKPQLHEVIKDSFIQLNVEAKDKYEAVRAASRPLLESGVITEQYIEKMIHTLKDDSKYMVITKGVALPHTKVEFGSKEIAVGITVLKNPIVFGNSNNDPVRYIFCLSVIDREMHLQALSSLVNLLSHSDFYDILNTATTTKEISNFIKTWEENEKIYTN